MSLLDEFARTCVFMEKTRVPDGAGGYLVKWAEGAQFVNYQSMDTSMEARVAEKQGVTSVYGVLVGQSVPVEYGDYFKDVDAGVTYRVTSIPEEKKAPRTATFNLKYFTAERVELTT